MVLKMKQNGRDVNRKMTPMVLAGDIGGTKTLLGVFARLSTRPGAIAVREFATLDFPDLPSMIARFLESAGPTTGTVEAACFGVAGPIVGDVAKLTNVPWSVDARGVAAALGLPRVRLLNDLQAMACAVSTLRTSEVHTLQEGAALPGGNIAVIAAGTGLGEALLHNIDGRLVPSPCEAGHADFAARNEREVALLRDLTKRYGRASVEHVVSGPGLVNIHRVTHTTACLAHVDVTGAGAPAAITEAAANRRCPECVLALDMFIDAYGAEAGNLALRALATGGVFIGGGIAPRILRALASGPFIQAFSAKPPMDALLARVPVKVILNAEAGLLGAAIFAASA
jgi:glucokinase